MSDVQTIPIERVYVPVKRRNSLKAEIVREIAESILELGHQAPILVRPDNGRFVLLDGLHRLEACRALGETTVAARIGSAPAVNDLPAYERQAETQREKTDRLRKLRLGQEEPTELAEATAEKSARSKKPITGSAQPIRSPDSTPRTTRKRPAASKPKNLSEWLDDQEQSGSRF